MAEFHEIRYRCRGCGARRSSVTRFKPREFLHRKCRKCSRPKEFVSYISPVGVER